MDNIVNSTTVFSTANPCDALQNNLSLINGTNNSLCQPKAPPFNIGLNSLSIIIVTLYGLICTIGLLGNGLVIFVVIRYTKMKTVTNMYILNLSIADGLFVLGLPLVMTTALIKHWIFGGAMCKLYYILTCINMFTGPFTLAVMSGDRFLAVCYPFSAIRYRWVLFFLVSKLSSRAIFFFKEQLVSFIPLNFTMQELSCFYSVTYASQS